MTFRLRAFAPILAAGILVGCETDAIDPPPGPVDHTFVYVPHAETPAITSINLAGSFAPEGDPEFWNPGLNPFSQQADGTWTLTKTLSPGSYEYKFVFNGDQWPGNMCADNTWGNPPGGPVDPDVEECVDDGHGGMNGLLVID